MTQQDASNRTTVDSGALKLALNVLRRAGKNEVADALEETAIRGQSALAEQDDEAVAYYHAETDTPVSKEQWEGLKVKFANDAEDLASINSMPPLYTRPATKTYTEHDIDVAIGVVEWDKLNLFATAEMVKQIVMRFVGSQVTMEVKRLSEDEVTAALICANLPPIMLNDIVLNKLRDFANALMDKMTGGGK